MNDACPLVLVRWIDSRQPSSAWCFLSELPEARAVDCASVGWLLRDGPDTKVISQSIGDIDRPEHAQANGVMAMPARCIISIEKLVEEDLTTSSSPASCPSSESTQLQQVS